MTLFSRRVFVLALLSLLAAAQVPAPVKPPAVRSEMLVSTQWLADHLNDAKVVIIHVTMDRSDYDKGHIPGARFLGKELAMAKDGLSSELPSDDALKATFEKLGVSDDTRVIIYSPHWYPVVARAYYTLDYMGHDNTALLNGSAQQWLTEKRPVKTAEDFAPTPGHLTLHTRPGVRAMLDEVKNISTSSDGRAVVLDSRPPKRYQEGHIPGAAHLFWEDTVVDADNNPSFKSPEELRKLLAARGISPNTNVVTYCESGWQASHNYFVLKYLGYDRSEMYDGSFNQWNDVEKLPVVKGAPAR